MVVDKGMSPLFQAAVEAVEAAVVNALLAGETLTGRDGITAHGSTTTGCSTSWPGTAGDRAPPGRAEATDGTATRGRRPATPERRPGDPGHPRGPR